MTRYAINYTRIPTHYNDSRVAVVEAESPQDALELLQHRLGDHSGVYMLIQRSTFRQPEREG